MLVTDTSTSVEHDGQTRTILGSCYSNRVYDIRRVLFGWKDSKCQRCCTHQILLSYEFPLNCCYLLRPSSNKDLFLLPTQRFRVQQIDFGLELLSSDLTAWRRPRQQQQNFHCQFSL